jgi:nitrogen fixation protein FixH
MTIIIDLTFKTKRKQNFYGQTTYIVKVSFFNVSVSINSYLAFNLEKKFNLIVAIYNLNKSLLFK